MFVPDVVEEEGSEAITVMHPDTYDQMSPVEHLTSGQNTLYFYRGRVALSAVLRALDLEPGDEVLLQAFTCLAVPLPIVGLRLRPVYLDIDRSTFNINPREVESRI